MLNNLTFVSSAFAAETITQEVVNSTSTDTTMGLAALALTAITAVLVKRYWPAAVSLTNTGGGGTTTLPSLGSRAWQTLGGIAIVTAGAVAIAYLWLWSTPEPAPGMLDRVLGVFTPSYETRVMDYLATNLIALCVLFITAVFVVKVFKDILTRERDTGAKIVKGVIGALALIVTVILFFWVLFTIVVGPDVAYGSLKKMRETVWTEDNIVEAAKNFSFSMPSFSLSSDEERAVYADYGFSKEAKLLTVPVGGKEELTNYLSTRCLKWNSLEPSRHPLGRIKTKYQHSRTQLWPDYNYLNPPYGFMGLRFYNTDTGADAAPIRIIYEKVRKVGGVCPSL